MNWVPQKRPTALQKDETGTMQRILKVVIVDTVHKICPIFCVLEFQESMKNKLKKKKNFPFSFACLISRKNIFL